MDTVERPELAVLHDAYCLALLEAGGCDHERLWAVLGALADGASGVEREEMGHSAEGRPLYALRFGRGPTRVLLWSQLHGDEAGSTMSLADLYAYWAREPEDPRVRRLGEALTVVAVPMLNPDGAERGARHDAQGFDLAGDTRDWRSPELRALRDLAIRFRPDVAFDLHDRCDLPATSGRPAALALLSSAADPGARERAERVCRAILAAVRPLVGDRVVPLAEGHDPGGLAEWLQHAGTATVRLTSGACPGEDEEQTLRTLRFVAILAALETLAA